TRSDRWAQRPEAADEASIRGCRRPRRGVWPRVRLRRHATDRCWRTQWRCRRARPRTGPPGRWAPSGVPMVPNDQVAQFAAEHADIAIAFASIDPSRGAEGVREAKRLVAAGGIRGLKLHPPLQAFAPNDRIAYPLYEVFAAAKLPVLFHTGHSGIGTGMPGGGGIRLKYGNPMLIDDVAVDFPEMPIIMAHPSFPWQDEAISICLHKPQVYIDLSGWSPKYFSPTLIQYANTLLKHKVLY